MTDARISTALPAHPKTKKLKKRLGADGPWALICLFLWARVNRPDGDLTGMSDEDIELACDWSGEDGALVAALVSVGFVDGEEGSRAIHDWEEHQPWSAGSEDRSERAKWRALVKHHGRDGAAARMPTYAAKLVDCTKDARGMDADSMLVAGRSMNDPAARSAPSPSPSPRSKEVTPIGVVGDKAADPPAKPAEPVPKAKAERLAQVTIDAVEVFNATLSKEAGGLLSAVAFPESDKRRQQVKRSVRIIGMACERFYGSPKIERRFWEDYFAECKLDPFRSGRGPYTNGHSNWMPDFEYLTRPDVIEKAIDDGLSRAA